MGSAAFLGPHAVFIVGAYAVTFTMVAVLVLWVWLDGRRQARLLADLEARGVRRRSAEASATAPAASAAVKEPAA